MITHIVLFKLKEPSPENVAAAKDKLISMQGNVPMLRHLEVGVDVVRSERSYDIALFTKFDSLADLQAYQTFPYHGEDVAPFMRAMSSSVAVVDYE